VNVGRPQNSRYLGELDCERAPTEPYSRILVVDDDPSIKGMVAIALQRVGYSVATANDGERGWEAICSEPFDLLITDYSMPRLNGLELLKRLRRNALVLPAILMSADMSRDVSEIIELVSQGGALHKPFRLEELYFKVGLILDRSQGAKAEVAGDSTYAPRDEGRLKRLIVQNAAESRLSQLAEKLLKKEAAAAKPEEGKPVLERVCAKMEKYLVTLAGVVGFRAVLARALLLSRPEVPWLKGVRVSEQGVFEDLRRAESDIAPSEIFRGETIVVSRILGSLVPLLGEPLTRACLDEVWREAL